MDGGPRAICQLAGITDMICMMMGDDDPGDRLLGLQLWQDCIPLGADLVTVYAAIHQHPAIVSIQRKQIDVVQPKGQPKPEPPQIIGDAHHLAIPGGGDIQFRQHVGFGWGSHGNSNNQRYTRSGLAGSVTIPAKSQRRHAS